MPNLNTLLGSLRQNAYLKDDAPPFDEALVPESLWIQALQMIGGWLAALFFLAFVGMTISNVFHNASAWLTIGVLLTLLSAFLIRKTQQRAFLRQFLIAMHFAGQGALLFGIASYDNNYDAHSSAVPYLLGGGYEAALLIITRSIALRVVAIWCMLGLWLIAIYQISNANLFILTMYPAIAFWLLACTLWWSETYWLGRRYDEICLAAAWALSLWVAYSVLSLTFNTYYFAYEAFDARYSFACISACSVLYCVVLAKPHLTHWRRNLALGLLIAALLLTWQAPAVGIGGLLLVFAWRNGRTWLLGFGMLLFVGALSRFYYDLYVTLLYKSGLMVAGGALLLAVRVLLSDTEQSTHEEKSA